MGMESGGGSRNSCSPASARQAWLRGKELSPLHHRIGAARLSYPPFNEESVPAQRVQHFLRMECDPPRFAIAQTDGYI